MPTQLSSEVKVRNTPRTGFCVASWSYSVMELGYLDVVLFLLMAGADVFEA